MCATVVKPMSSGMVLTCQDNNQGESVISNHYEQIQVQVRDAIDSEQQIVF